MRATLALLLCAGCASARYPVAAPAHPAPPTTRPGPGAADSGHVSRIRALEQQCRGQLNGDTLAASLAALDRVQQVMAEGCELRTVRGNPLHWRLSCRSDALFESGTYRPSSRRKTACRELAGGAATTWQCAGAVLQGLVGTGERAVIRQMGLAVLGHADMEPLPAGSESHLCPELHMALGYEPEVTWQPVAGDATEAERLYANDQLAFCRASAVATDIERGMTRARKRRVVDGAAGLTLAVAGLGASWLQSRPLGQCPGHGRGWQQRPDCEQARRVDVLLRFEPTQHAETSSCSVSGDDASTALFCLQECREQAAVGARMGSGTGAARALFVEPQAQTSALPVGWHLVERTGESPLRLDLEHVCQLLDIDPLHCELR